MKTWKISEVLGDWEELSALFSVPPEIRSRPKLALPYSCKMAYAFSQDILSITQYHTPPLVFG
jgi:hypothetical protein